MKAWVLHAISDIRLDEVPGPVPQPQAGEVLVKVKCAGICSSDIPRIFKTGTYSYPLIPGHEFSGETPDGRRVAVFPLLPCFSCPSCAEGSYETCSSYSYFGSRRDGGFAQYIAVPGWNLVDIPDAMSFEAAAMIEPAAVALHAVRRLDITAVSRAAVVGSGIIGELISMWLIHDGIDDVELLGRESHTEYVPGFDACFEAAGTAQSLERCIGLVRPGGQVMLVGNPDAAFSIGRALYWQIMRKQITVRGVWNSRYPDDWNTVVRYAGKLNPERLITHRYPFDKLGDALEMMRGKKEKHKKVMLMV